MNETEPLLQGSASEQYGEAVSAVAHQAEQHLDPTLKFDPNGDEDNPLEWSNAYKWAIVGLIALNAFTVTTTCTSAVPIANMIVSDLSDGQVDRSAATLLVTLWELGESAGPLLIAPLSEVFGRAVVYNVCNTLFTITVMLTALCQSAPLFITLRAATGLFVAANVLSPAVIGDMFLPDHRGGPMSVIFLAPLTAGAVGPAIAGAIAQSIGWRSVMWICALVAGSCEVAFLFCFRETYSVPILRRRAEKRREGLGLSAEEIKAKKAASYAELKSSIQRPAAVMGSSFVLASMSLFGSVYFAQFYVMSVSFPPILEDLYGLTPAQAGSCLIGWSVGSMAAVMLCNVFLDRIYVRLRDAAKNSGIPEYRLPLTIVGAILLPLPLAVFGWFTQWRLPIAALIVASSLVMVSVMLVLVTLSSYVVDAFGLYSASAMTGVIISRCLMGSFLPLTAAPLVERLDYGWGFTVLAAVPFSLMPIPMLVMRYGPRWRQWSRYTREQ
ncbi:hypothetical protein NLU13_6833 [Sarocladium strictum]|uniref:Major facilitator superfamily (MFS) profile domain-containing protein n=1 Tax=Sarocladium strictum TaxID=5046 RepID=A0AA39GEF2_SARSR|nr:hypothetical protein NLU13_6833 [Sarocladium strictum]